MMLDMTSVFVNLWGLFCDLACVLAWRMFHMHLIRICILLLWDRMFYYISIKLTWSSASFKARVSLIFCLDDHPSIGISGVLKSPTIIVLLLISPLCPLIFICNWNSFIGRFLHPAHLFIDLVICYVYGSMDIYFIL